MRHAGSQLAGATGGPTEQSGRRAWWEMFFAYLERCGVGGERMSQVRLLTFPPWDSKCFRSFIHSLAAYAPAWASPLVFM